MKRSRRIALLALAAFMLSACENLPALKGALPGSSAEETTAPAPTVTATPTPSGTARDAGTTPSDLRQIIEALQDGRLQQGRAGLVSLLGRDPKNQTARSLLRQIDDDPEVLLGSEYILYTVRRGDTLGELAARHLGDSIRFLALARYNGIERPRSLQVGQTLRIPHAQDRTPPPSLPEEATPAPVQEPVETSPPVEASMPSEAPQTPAAITTGTPRPDPARVAEYHEAAVVHYRNQQLDEAIALWDQVLELDPGFEQARGYRTRALELKRRLQEFERP